MDLTHQSSAYLLGARACSKSDRACLWIFSSKFLWSSLVSCEEMSQARKQSMAPWSKLKHDQISHWCKDTHNPPCTSSRALKRETSACEATVTLSQARVTNIWRTLELVYPSLWLNEIQRMKSVRVFWVYWEEGWIASPDASRSAERRDTSAMDFEDSLPKSDIRHSPEHTIRHGTAKQNPGRNSQVAAVKPNMCLLQLCHFFVIDFGLQFILWDQFSDNGPHPPVICLSAWGTSMLKKRQGLSLDFFFQVFVELPGFLWRDESSKKTIHGSMVQIKTWPNIALMQGHTQPTLHLEQSA